jgi:diguanylate cyclase (GGDEF)-like protein
VLQVRLRELAQTDPLTGLYNRRGFRRMAEREIERSKRTGSSLTLVHLDLDGFKELNDRRGHAEGDEVLVAVGRSLKASRAMDVASRLGGDEFGLLLPDTTYRAAESAVGRIVSMLTGAMAARGWPITFGVGAATFHAPRRSLDEMVGVADGLMYEVKNGGKAGVRHRDVGGDKVSGL